MKSSLLKILFSTDNKKLEEKRKRRQDKANAEIRTIQKIRTIDGV